MNQSGVNGGNEVATNLLRAFGSVLNRHGYSFQYAAVEAARDAYDRGASPWHFQMSEVPVQVQGKDTRVDFVLKHKDKPVHMLAECKRANPALSNWCFLRAPYVVRGTPSMCLMLEKVDRLMNVCTISPSTTDESYHIALEVKSGATGDNTGGKAEAVEDAATQICRGVNGYMELLAARQPTWARDGAAILLPVIFTTATIYSSDVDLLKTDLTTGNLDVLGSHLTREQWLILDYHQSAGLKHARRRLVDAEIPNLRALMRAEFIRSIAVVSSDGIGPFLQWSGRLDFG